MWTKKDEIEYLEQLIAAKRSLYTYYLEKSMLLAAEIVADEIERCKKRLAAADGCL